MTWQSLVMTRPPRRVSLLVIPAIVALAASGALTEHAASGQVVPLTDSAHPRVTNRCPVDTLPLGRVDLPALRLFALRLALHGVHKLGSRAIDYRDARARASFPTFYTGYVRIACPKRLVQRVIHRAADVLVRYRRGNWGPSPSFCHFLISPPPPGPLGLAQMSYRSPPCPPPG